MSNWRKVKGLFWQSSDPAPTETAELSDAEFQELLASEHAVPQRAVPPLSVSSLALGTDGHTVSLDFQAQYDAAGIPNTDEVEQLELFLGGLDHNLAHASKLAAARAFLGAVGKSVDDVLRDAERKIDLVRAVLSGKGQATQAAIAEQQAAIAELSATIERHRAQMETLTRELEGVRNACLTEEVRLQAARVFFGQAGHGPGQGQNQ